MFRFQRVVMFAFIAVFSAAGVPTHKSAQQVNPANPASAAKAQDPAQNPLAQAPSKQEVVRISTQLVQVDAVVTDKKGHHVVDLAQDDFELLMDGKKQPLTHFTRVALPGAVKRELPPKKKTDAAAAPESMPTRQIAPSEVRRTIAFIVDDLGLSFRSTQIVRETLKKFVDEQMQEGDLVAIIRTGNGLGLLEQFTSDKRILYTAIDRLIWNPLSRDMTPKFDDSTAEVSDDQADMQAVLDSFEEFRETSFSRGTLSSIAYVVQGLRGLPGRKSVILLSDGFRVYSQTDNDNTTELILRAMQNLVELASRSSVVVYAMDAKGLQPFMPGADVGGRPSVESLANAQQSALEALDGPVFLARETGGFLVTNTNDLNIGIQEALYDQQSYYLLGFDPEDEKFDQKFHQIKVRVKRPGLTLRTRSGFFGINETEGPGEPKTRGQQILASLLSPLGKRDLPVRMTPYFFNAAKEGPLVRTLFHLDCSKLTFKDGPNGQKLLNLELAAFAFDENGATADLTAHRLRLSFNEQQYRRVLANGLAYSWDFPLKKPGAYQFRAVLRDDESGLTGSASQFIQVPDLSKKHLAMSGLILTAPKPTAASNDEAAAVAASPTRAGKPAGESSPSGGLPTSPYVRRFPRTGWVQYGAAIYNATTDKKTGQPQITVRAEIYRDGKPFRQFPASRLDFSPGVNPNRFDYVGRMRLNDFPEGDYLLHLIVTDGLAKKKYARAEQWMDFSVK